MLKHKQKVAKCQLLYKKVICQPANITSLP